MAQSLPFMITGIWVFPIDSILTFLLPKLKPIKEKKKTHFDTTAPNKSRCETLLRLFFVVFFFVSLLCDS